MEPNRVRARVGWKGLTETSAPGLSQVLKFSDKGEPGGLSNCKQDKIRDKYAGEETRLYPSYICVKLWTAFIQLPVPGNFFPLHCSRNGKMKNNAPIHTPTYVFTFFFF